MIQTIKKNYLCEGLIVLFLIVMHAGTTLAAEVSLSWNPPTTNEDNTPLTDLDGYIVYYGTETGNYSESINVGNVTTYQVAGLATGAIYYFTLTAYDTSGNESEYAVEKSFDMTLVNYYCDSDNDGYIDSSIDGTCIGAGCQPSGCLTTAGNDCNDSNLNINIGGDDSNCNGIDENCDGTADNNYVASTTSCGEGVCGSTGQLTCSNGSIVDTCTAGESTGDDSNCNGIDENCDGIADNNYIVTATTCGESICEAAGQLTCSNGSIVDTCAVTQECVIVITEETVINTGDEWKYSKGFSAPESGWNSIDFDDSSWMEGPSGIGYGDGDDATVLYDMQNSYLSIYARKAFNITDRDSVTVMSLDIDYDDGFVAYLNGQEIASANMPDGIIDHNTEATAREAGAPETFDLSEYVSYLVTGTNVLAFEVHNKDISSADLSFIPEFTVTTSSGGPVDYYCDSDNDGYYNSSVEGTCAGADCIPTGCRSAQGDDCNDGNAGINPGETEIKNDGIDQDCSGSDLVDLVPPAAPQGFVIQ